MRTQCCACGKTFARPETAEKHHTEKHQRVSRTVGGVIDGQFVKEWATTSKGYYLGGISWGEFSRT